MSSSSSTSTSTFVSTAELRRIFLDFFEQRGHKVVASSSLVPVGDDSLFFTNAGMVQFKGVFLGVEQRDYRRATTVQRCLRASGKHNDLENVGYTTRHHTFFEMLGNFSFGDYFKAEVIHFAWTLLTERLQLPAERLWVTVHKDDYEAEELWRAEFAKSGRHAQGISHCDDHDNFWSMGDTGPCGYCSEIFYDHGEQFIGDPPGGKIDGERYIEIWNLVFMQFERDRSGHQGLLPKPSIDTGIGLERLAAVLQGVHDNYDIDLFREMLADFAKVLSSDQTVQLDKVDAKLYRIASRVVVDHIRSTVFLMADGVVPSNDKHGYVLRSIMRRALFYLYQLGVRSPLFYRMVPSVVRVMGDAYPELNLAGQQQHIMQLVREEEEKFLVTIGRGIELLEQELPKCQGGVLSGALAFKMHDTYGLPLALSSELARQAGLQIDQAGFDAELARQRSASRQDMKANAKDLSDNEWLQGIPATKYLETYVGQDETSRARGQLLAIGRSNEAGKMIGVDVIKKDDEAVLVLDCSGFYAESGGAVGDRGYLVAETGDAKFKVTDTKKCGDIYLHYGRLEQGRLGGNRSQVLVSYPDLELQSSVRANHTATHLLQASLRKLLGPQVVQRGSLVNEHLLRFDFAYNKAVTAEQLAELERMVNQEIWRNEAVAIEHMHLDDAKKSGAMALFGERYGEEVRVVKVANFSMELCGGLHVSRTGSIGSFKIKQESGVAAGVRRIVAVTRSRALEDWQLDCGCLAQLGQMLGVDATASDAHAVLVTKLSQLIAQNGAQRQQIAAFEQQSLSDLAQRLWERREEIAAKEVKYQLIFADGLKNLDPAKLKQLWDHLKQREKVVAFLRLVEKDREYWLVGVSGDLTNDCDANQFLRKLMQVLQGKGGGKCDLAQGSAPCLDGHSEKIEISSLWLQRNILCG